MVHGTQEIKLITFLFDGLYSPTVNGEVCIFIYI